MINRRAFLRTAGAAAAAACAGVNLGCQRGIPAPGTAVRSGTLPPLDRVGLQLSTVRELWSRDLRGTLREVARTGYRTVETTRDLFDRYSPAEVRAALDEFGLRAPSGFFPYPVFRDDLDRVIETVAEVGQTYAGIPGLPPEVRSSRAAIREIADQFNEVGARLQRQGLQFFYHNHQWEFETLGGDSTLLDILLERTDPGLVDFELDLGWTHRAGHDPVAFIDRYPGRFSLFHVKDFSAAPEHEIVPVGEGVIDFGRILSRAAAAGLQYAYVEHDNPPNPLESMRVSYATLADMLPRS